MVVVEVLELVVDDVELEVEVVVELEVELVVELPDPVEVVVVEAGLEPVEETAVELVVASGVAPAADCGDVVVVPEPVVVDVDDEGEVRGAASAPLADSSLSIWS